MKFTKEKLKNAFTELLGQENFLMDQTTVNMANRKTTEKNNEGITALTPKAWFGVPKTVLWLIKH